MNVISAGKILNLMTLTIDNEKREIFIEKGEKRQIKRQKRNEQIIDSTDPLVQTV